MSSLSSELVFIIFSSSIPCRRALCKAPVLLAIIDDIDHSVTKGQNFYFFSQMGAVVSVRARKDRIRRVSLGYGYDNYQNAQEVIDELELPFEGILDYHKIARFVSSSDAQPGWLVSFLRNINPTQIKEMLANLAEYLRHFLYSSPSQPLGPEDLTWRMVTKDNCPIIFHDNFILTEEDGNILERRATDLYLEEFLSYGPQIEPGGKKLLRRLKDGRVFNWNVETDSPFCTLEEAFKNVDSHLGFNIELKFDDSIVYQEEELTHILEVILQVIFQHAGGRPIIFSSFQPDAARLMRKLQNDYPVYFLTNGGNEIYADVRRNSLEEAIKMCLASGLQGIVSESRAIFRNPSMIPKIKESNLALLTYGQLNNVPEAVYMHHMMGINGVIVDLVEKITEAASGFTSTYGGEERSGSSTGEGVEERRPRFAERELSFLLKLIPELVQV